MGALVDRYQGNRTPKDKVTRTWDDNTFGIFVLPGNDGKAAPVFAGGSNIGISAKSKNPGLAKTLLKIIFSPTYQTDARQERPRPGELG